MIERLVMRDFVLVERAEVSFGPGLNVVTGETGAGKSLLVQAVDLLMGGRADADVVREGASAAVVEGVFRPGRAERLGVAARLEAWGIDAEDVVIVRREVSGSGRSRAWVNQSSVTRASLRELGEELADLHGQHEHQSLLRPGAGLDVLDRLGGHDELRGRFAEARAAWREASTELGRLESSVASLVERRAGLEQAAREIDEAKLEAGEDERLRQEAARLAHGERLRTLVQQALDALTEGDAAAQHAVAQAIRGVEPAAALDASLAPLLPTLDEARIAVSEVSRALADYLGSLEADPQALEAIEARRETIARLVRRHRRAVPELIEWRAEIARELALGEDEEGTLARARERLDATRNACETAGRALSRARRAAGREWGARLTRELRPLGFPHAELAFAIEPSAAGEAGPLGFDDVELRFAANPGEPARPLAKIASGGELSRVMLALKTALEAQDPVDLLFFDEVDSGIGGAVAQAVGERLRRLARHRQIVCVTHLPMIAALASHHLRVTKRVAARRTVARIEPVDGAERVDELARMLAGDRVTDTTRRQARELLGENLTGRA